MADTYKALSTVTVGAGGAANMSFTNIPQTYTDLKIVISARNSNAGNDATRVQLRFNGASTDANLTFRRIYGNGSTAASDSGSTGHVAWSNQSNSTANTFSNIEVYIPNYAGSNPKSFSADGGNEANQVQAYFGMFGDLWNSTSPITSITIFSESGENWVQHTTATLYGVFNADVSSAPATPTIGTATAGVGEASITFTGVSNAASYTMTSTPGSITATGTTSPITVSGLTNGTAYTFKVKANNPFGSSAESAASNSVTPVGTAYESIATVTVGSGGATTVDFTSIPSTYSHLQIRAIMRGATAATDVQVDFRINGNSSSVYTYHHLQGTGSSMSVTGGGAGTTGNLQRATAANASAGQVGAMILDILDYANTNKFKTLKQMGGDVRTSAGSLFLTSSGFLSTSAISSISIYPNTGNWAQHTQFALYGIRSA